MTADGHFDLPTDVSAYTYASFSKHCQWFVTIYIYTNPVIAK